MPLFGKDTTPVEERIRFTVRWRDPATGRSRAEYVERAELPVPPVIQNAKAAVEHFAELIGIGVTVLVIEQRQDIGLCWNDTGRSWWLETKQAPAPPIYAQSLPEPMPDPNRAIEQAALELTLREESGETGRYVPTCSRDGGCG